ncbi:hypothetical protein K469DRAFT_713537 [Zopfia rhizophila CBS 207.26]|uniref:Uncharacterized protein n=1 Tax=Zopfia rhizophila CBS 207.26 TaxID=1314779 RepID=A0A6A6DPI8_9PEZI|nr:hypothetical protein K469DRAFT_713537 [Zopfia rhizophila CBS 207.26]
MDHLPGRGVQQESGPSLCGRSQLLKRQRMARSHIVASNLQEEPPGYITMNVEGRAVQMRKSDCWLNATQILLLAGKNVNDLRSIYDTLRRYARWQLRQDTIEGILHNQFWVCYHVGRRLSEVLDVSNALGPLLEYGRKTAAPLNEKDDKLDPISRYFEKILSINARKGILSIRLQDLWVNADHICREAEIDWSSFKGREEYKADHYGYVMSGPRAFWGHYTNPSNALRLCVMLHLEQLELLLRATLEKHGYQYEGASKAVPHTNVPAICEKEPAIELDVQDPLSWVWPDYENAETVTAPLPNLGSPTVNGSRHQNFEDGPTAAKSPPYIPEWDGLFLPPFRLWESERKSVS